MGQAWIDAGNVAQTPQGTRVIKSDGEYVLVEHDSIPPEADHVSVVGGRFIVVPNPEAVRRHVERGLNQNVMEMSARTGRIIPPVAVRDSDTRPKDGDAKQGSARE